MNLAKTARGFQEVNKRSVQLRYGQRQALGLFNGWRRTEVVLELLAHLDVNATDVQYLMDLGFLEEREPAPPPPNPPTHGKPGHQELGKTHLAQNTSMA
jgi:hypothetical protein